MPNKVSVNEPYTWLSEKRMEGHLYKGIIVFLKAQKIEVETAGRYGRQYGVLREDLKLGRDCFTHGLKVRTGCLRDGVEKAKRAD